MTDDEAENDSQPVTRAERGDAREVSAVGGPGGAHVPYDAACTCRCTCKHRVTGGTVARMNVSSTGETPETVGDSDLRNWFTYHPPKPDQPRKYEVIRDEGRVMAGIVTRECPPSWERDQALLRLREAVMWANASIACNE